MKSTKLLFVGSLMALCISSLFCVDTPWSKTLFTKQVAISPIMHDSDAKPFEADMAKFFYYPENWRLWYRFYTVECAGLLEEDWENNSWVLAYNNVVTRTNGKPVTVVMSDHTGGDVEQYKVDYTYSATHPNLPETITMYHYESGQWIPGYRENYTYNSYGGFDYVTNEEYYSPSGWQMIIRADCTSDANRLIHVFAEEYSVTEGVWENDMLMDCTWSGEQLMQVIWQYWENNWVNDEKKDFSYSNQDELNQITKYLWSTSSNTWREDYRTNFTFVNGMYSEELIQEYINPGGWVNSWKGILTYNASGYPTMQMGYGWNNGTLSWITEERMTFSYDGSSVDDVSTPVLLPPLSVSPNPFRGITSISFQLPKPAPATLNIYNTRGQLVRHLFGSTASSGKHFITWDGKDDCGAQMPSGLYFYRFQTIGMHQSAKLLLLK